ncbi:hypothetical protein B0H67DRAFT_483240 [Lasiosphaeris hirsuta]|uniref:Uncharacterized protein n=1 Tax=Lasiosphaeris hirsuta TaxID=260670 RepID=A0AA40DYA2_9PEZI|nr:hypothetical protein B0H67DRAFT_483240 [Lasiosphaeris hirsuta]
MAFHQPARHFQQRVARVHSEDGELEIPAPQTRPEQTESQTWVLFTPGTDAGTTASYLSLSQDDQVTPGRSRVSDLGSLDTAARSDFNSQADNSAVPTEFLEQSVTEDDAELDSLDSHLSEFRTAPNSYAQQQGASHTAPVFPGHDGLGSFRFDAPGISAEGQDRLYAFERFNPNRVKRRRESFELARLELENEEAQELERNRRIEAWRLEQSQFLLEDIQKETRRRRQSQASLQKLAQAGNTTDTRERIAADKATDEAHLAGSDWHDQDGAQPGDTTVPADTGRGLWSHITRKVICDLMGIDDKLLAVLFGEALPDDMDLSFTPEAPRPDSSPAFAHIESESLHDSNWQLHMLERIARELGQFVNRMSSHPGAFSTYTRVQQMPLPYAGLPVIPEAPADSNEPAQNMDGSVPSMPQFRPTVMQPTGAQPHVAPTTTAPSAPSLAGVAPSDTQQSFTQQEWEQDLDIKLVFRYLRSRFTPSRPSSPPFTSGTSHLATSSTQDLAAKAARVRQHHPLVSHSHVHHRPRPAERRTFKATTPSSPVVLRHGGGSCASQSTRRSGRRSSVSSRHSSRHYWDIGNSVGTGSIIASSGPMGSWGEV